MAGIAVLVLGTFLPWLRSGRATRNSYEATGAVRRLVHPPGVLDDLFRIWPLLGAVCALAVAVYVLGLRVDRCRDRGTGIPGRGCCRRRRARGAATTLMLP